jgi:hypothetical protein
VKKLILLSKWSVFLPHKKWIFEDFSGYLLNFLLLKDIDNSYYLAPINPVFDAL